MVDVLARAFSDDPVFLHMLPLAMDRREDRLRRFFFFAMELPRSERLGGAWTTVDGAGAAVLYPPGLWKPSLWLTIRQTPSMLRILGRQASVAGRVLSTMQEHHQRPHWYLLYVAAEAGRRGTGLEPLCCARSSIGATTRESRPISKRLPRGTGRCTGDTASRTCRS